MKKMMLVKTIIIPLAFLISSCSTSGSGVATHHVATDTVADVEIIPKGFPKGSSFAIVSEGDSLISQEMGQKIAKILEKEGYRVKEPKSADYYLTFNYKINRSVETVNIPFVIPGATSTTAGSVIFENKAKEGYIKEAELKGSTILIPEQLTYFTKELSIVVSNPMKQEVWQGKSLSKETSNDIKTATDLLLTSAFKHFGQNTEKHR